jgi:hypothetical protein
MEAQMTELEALGAIEAIKVLKAQYCRFLDTKAWDRWAELYTADATVAAETSVDGGEAKGLLAGRAQIVRWVRQQVEAAVTVHRVSGPEIEILSPTAARGVWAMDDVVAFPEGVEAPFRSLRGSGHYREEYAFDEGRWRIQTLRLSRLREIIE